MFEKTDHDQLVSVAVGFIMEGHTRRDIEEWLRSVKGDPEAAATFDAACEKLQEAHRTTKAYNRAFVVEGLKEMYRRLVEIGDYEGAAKVLIHLEKIRKP